MLEGQDGNHSIHIIKCTMLELLNARYADIQDVEYLALVRLLDKRHKGNL